MSANNVVQGPWGSLPPHPSDETVSMDVYIQYTYLVNRFFDDVQNIGIDIETKDDYIKDMALIAESIRGLLYKVKGKYHPPQDIAEAFFDWSPENRLTMQKSLNVEFKPLDNS